MVKNVKKPRRRLQQRDAAVHCDAAYRVFGGRSSSPRNRDPLLVLHAFLNLYSTPGCTHNSLRCGSKHASRPSHTGARKVLNEIALRDAAGVTWLVSCPPSLSSHAFSIRGTGDQPGAEQLQEMRQSARTVSASSRKRWAWWEIARRAPTRVLPWRRAHHAGPWWAWRWESMARNTSRAVPAHIDVVKGLKI